MSSEEKYATEDSISSEEKSPNSMPESLLNSAGLEELKAGDALREKSDRAYEPLFKERAIKIWINNYSTSILPIMLITNQLSIFWANSKFEGLYGNYREYIGVDLTKFFFNSFEEEEKLASLYKSLTSPESVYCWRGAVEKKGKNDLSIHSNLLIIPIFRTSKEYDEPLAFVVILDDVSSEHRKLLRDTFRSLLEASMLKDNDTGNHIKRVNSYSRRMAEYIMGNPEYSEIDREFIDNIGFLAAMHDVGKIGTSDNILNKDGPLEEWEWEIMKEHTINGAFILSTYPNPMAKEIALFHHERWDGNGYPYGVSERMIPLSARIVALADVYDALRMKRTYKSSMSHDEAMDIIINEEQNHFDPQLREHFLKIAQDFASIYNKLKD